MRTFCPNTRKSEIPANKNSLKKSDESMTPAKNVELTDRRSERQTDDGDFIGPSVYKNSIYKGNMTIPAF